MMRKKNIYLSKAACAAALYAALTYISAVFGLAYTPVQFRISEALAVLPVFSAAFIPGLAVGCAAANIISPVTPLDAVIGSCASLLAALLTRKLRNIKLKGLPVLSFAAPVVVNSLFIAFEAAIFSGKESRAKIFVLSALGVGAGEAAVVFSLGLLLFYAVNKNYRVRSLLEN